MKPALITPDQFVAIAELTALWDRITHDGKVSRIEFVMLRHWFLRRKQVRFPQLDQVRDLFHEIVKDKRITASELRDFACLVRSIKQDAESRPLLDDLPDLHEGSTEALMAKAPKVITGGLPPKTRSGGPSVEFNAKQGFVRAGSRTWGIPKILNSLNASGPGDYDECSGTSVLTTGRGNEDCWQCEGTGWYVAQEERKQRDDRYDKHYYDNGCNGPTKQFYPRRVTLSCW